MRQPFILNRPRLCIFLMPTVLLVVGMQNDKCSRCSTVLVPRVNACIRAAQTRGWRVVFALDLHHPRHISFQTETPHCILQTLGAGMASGLLFGFPGSDLIVRGVDQHEDSNDAFFISEPSNTYSLLRTMLCGGNTRLCLCGASPDGCLEQTTLTASLRGYCRGDPIIISDASYLCQIPASLVCKDLDHLLALWD